MEKIIKAAVERGASDLHIKAGDVFRARINGKLVPLTKQRLTPDQTRAIALKLITNDEDRAQIDRLRDFDCSWGMPGVGRFRVNVLRQRSSFMIVMRVIPFTVPTIESLRLPEVLKQIAESERGLVLVTGVSGSGKSSTVAAMVHHINRTQHKHVVTIENPIEFLHRDLSCSITQREVGVDTDSLADRAPGRAAPGSRRRRARRDRRRRHDRHRDQGRGDRPPGHRHDADAGRRDHHRAGHRHAAAGGAGDRPDAVLRGAARDRLPAAAAGEGRQGPGRRRRGHARHAGGTGVPEGPDAHRRSAEASWRTAAKQLGTQTYEQHLAELIEAELITAETAKAALALISPAPAGGKRGEAGRGLPERRHRVPTLKETDSRVLPSPAKPARQRRQRPASWSRPT